MYAYPKIRTVAPLDNCRLRVIFDNGVCKIYDCKPLLQKPVFAPLADGWLFRSVQADPSGYGVSWNEDIDLAESELWEHGLTLETTQSVAASPCF
jgi:hypothetical protein